MTPRKKQKLSSEPIANSFFTSNFLSSTFTSGELSPVSAISLSSSSIENTVSIPSPIDFISPSLSISSSTLFSSTPVFPMLTSSLSTSLSSDMSTPLIALSVSSLAGDHDSIPSSSTILLRSTSDLISSSSTSSLSKTLWTVKRDDTNESFNCIGNPIQPCKNIRCRKCFDKSFASNHLAVFWSTNNTIPARLASAKSSKFFYLDCPKCEHMFDKQLKTTAKLKPPNNGCRYCAGRDICEDEKCQFCYKRSFASHEKSKYWSSKNELKPWQVSKCTHIYYYFDCPNCPHTFQGMPKNISCNNSWCPFCCVGAKELCKNQNCDWCRKKSFISHPMAVNWSPTNTLSPRQVSICCNSKFDFVCNVCKHIYSYSPSDFRKGNENEGCSFCSHKKLCESKECKFCEINSFASHPMAQFWSSKNKLTPRQLFPYSNGRFEFNCEKCPHSFGLNLIDIQSGYRCPYCNHSKLCEKKDCDFCFKNSFASSIHARNWSTRNSISSRRVFLNSNTIYEFDCVKCGHEFRIEACNCRRSDKTGGCKYCAHKKLCDKECKWCHEHSFASIPLSEQWSVKNIVMPRHVFRSSTTKYLFDCRDCGLEFKQYPCHATYKGSGCPWCHTKTENLFANYLFATFSEEKVVRQAKFDWCKNKNHLPFDFCLENLRIIVEIDGKQHFEQVSNWKSPKLTLKRDVFKMKKALAYGYSIVRISQEDIWNDHFDWKTDCKEYLKVYTTPSVFYLAKDSNLYDKHKKKML